MDHIFVKANTEPSWSLPSRFDSWRSIGSFLGLRIVDGVELHAQPHCQVIRSRPRCNFFYAARQTSVAAQQACYTVRSSPQARFSTSVIAESQISGAVTAARKGWQRQGALRRRRRVQRCSTMLNGIVSVRPELQQGWGPRRWIRGSDCFPGSSRENEIWRVKPPGRVWIQANGEFRCTKDRDWRVTLFDWIGLMINIIIGQMMRIGLKLC